MGVDIVDLARVERAARRGGELFARRLTTEAERALGPGPAVFSVKESLIKAVGSRPPGFTWHDFEAAAPLPAGRCADLLDEAATELAGSTGFDLTGGASYTVRGASARAATRRLNGRGGVAGAARWGEGDGLFVSLAIVFMDGSV